MSAAASARRDTLGPVRGELGERHRVVGESERGQLQTRIVQDAARLGPLRQPCPRHLEDRPHAHAHASPVEGVRAARAHEHRVRTEARGRAEDGAHVRVVDDVFEHDDQPCSGDDVVHGCQWRAVHRHQRAAMDGIPGETLCHVRLDDVDGGLGMRSRDGFDVRQPLLLHQNGSRAMPRGHRSPDHLGGLRHVEPARRFQHSAERDIRQISVIGQPLVVRRPDSLDAHGTTLAERVTSPKSGTPTLCPRG